MKSPALNQQQGFTLVELLVVIAIIGILSAILLPVLNQSRLSAQCAVCQSNLRQLGVAAQMYWNDNGGNCFRYNLGTTNFDNLTWEVWWFGRLQQYNGSNEGKRKFDLSYGFLFPYLNQSDARLCPSPVWNWPTFQFKGTNFIFSYAYNSYPGANPMQTAGQIVHPGNLTLFADSAQVDTFQGRGTPANPVFEEWYYLQTNDLADCHFRHSQKANVVFFDGHVGMETMVPGSLDLRMSVLNTGKLRPEILDTP